MTPDQVRTLVEGALAQVVREDRQLLDRDVSERSVAFRLALSMAQSPLIRRPITIDCEYNRHIGDKKRLRLPPRKAGDGGVEPRLVHPDILIHERGRDENNILVLEVKKPGELMARDALKLAAFKEQLEYAHAAHVIVGLDDQLAIVQEIVWI